MLKKILHKIGCFLRLVSLKFAKYIKYWHKWNTDDRMVSKEKEGCVSIYSENIVMDNV